MKRWLTVPAVLMVCALARAEQAQAPVVGTDTRAWLELQRSGAASAPQVQPVPGEVADKVYQRYLNSFDQPIPAQFDRESFVGRSGSGS